MLNRATFQIIGRVGGIRPNKDGKVRYISIATGYSVKVEDKWENRTRWNDVKVLNERLIARVDNQIKVGELVIFEGILERSQYKNREGELVSSNDIILKEFDILTRKTASPAVPAATPESDERPELDANISDQAAPVAHQEEIAVAG